jgi:hypothetical protein
MKRGGWRRETRQTAQLKAGRRRRVTLSCVGDYMLLLLLLLMMMIMMMTIMMMMIMIMMMMMLLLLLLLSSSPPPHHHLHLVKLPLHVQAHLIVLPSPKAPPP